jgi:hypothetical protein
LLLGRMGGCVHWTPPFLVDVVYHISLIVVAFNFQTSSIITCNNKDKSNSTYITFLFKRLMLFIG